MLNVSILVCRADGCAALCCAVLNCDVTCRGCALYSVVGRPPQNSSTAEGACQEDAPRDVTGGAPGDVPGGVPRGRAAGRA
eukprot:7651841-Pyramimonas_sp.AAC.1